MIELWLDPEEAQQGGMVSISMRVPAAHTTARPEACHVVLQFNR